MLVANVLSDLLHGITDADTDAIGNQGLYAVFLLMMVDAVLPAASEVVMVGDSWAADVIGARAAGIKAIWFNPERLPSPEPGAGVAELYSLEPVDQALATIFAELDEAGPG